MVILTAFPSTNACSDTWYKHQPNTKNEKTYRHLVSYICRQSTREKESPLDLKLLLVKVGLCGYRPLFSIV